MLVNPSLNIAIGKYGKSCNDSFHNHFMDREKDLKNYASFYHLEKDDNRLKYSSVHQDEIENSIPLNFEENTDNLFSSDDTQFFLKGFINTIYNDQINLLDQLNTKVNFEIVNINIILSSFENLNAELADNLIKNIKELCDEGMISQIVVKAFVILSKDGNLLNQQEEIVVYNNLEKLKVIQKDNNSIFTNIIFIDDKNTSAVFLDINPKSIGFVLNEFITYLMTNHYNMLGNLMNSEFLSIGIGMLYFDEIFFRKFFQSRIIDAKIIKEQLDPEEHLIITSHYKKIRDKFFLPIVNKTGKGEIDPLIDACKTIELHKNCTLKSYEFLLSHLTGDFTSVTLKEPLLNVDKISIYDTLYQLIKNTFTSLGGVEIIEHKKLLDEIDNLKARIKDHKKENEDGLLDLTIDKIEKELLEKRSKAKEQELQVKTTLKEFKKKDQVVLKTQIVQPLKESIQVLQKKRDDATFAFKKKFFIFKWFTRAEHKRELASINEEILRVETTGENTHKTLESLSSTVKDLYQVVDDLEIKYKNLQEAIEVIFDLKQTYNVQYESSKLFDYLFINHVIDKELLLKYFEDNTPVLLNNLNNSIEQLTNGKPFYRSNFKIYLEETIDEIIDGIIDFKMVYYLLNKYENLNLLKKVVPQRDISDLTNISVPFFNAVNAFANNNSHNMILHKEHREIDTKNLRDSLGQVFNIVPQQIRTLNPNKFSLVKIDVIPDFTSLVKYNMSKKRFEKDKLKTN